MCSQAFANSNQLKPCPNKPNCVSSLADDEHAIAPFEIKDGTTLNPQQVANLIEQLDTHVSVIFDEHRVHAEITSRVFGFVDDLDLLLQPEQNLIHVRSASRTGHYDFGVNRRRVEKLRSLLQEAGIIQ
jgi:uncharacterized protein (DUF1499 family)